MDINVDILHYLLSVFNHIRNLALSYYHLLVQRNNAICHWSPTIKEWIIDLESFLPWWRHQMETFSALLAIYAGNSPLTGELPTQRPVTPSYCVFFDLRLNKQVSKQSWGWWFETPSRPLWHHCNAKKKPWQRFDVMFKEGILEHLYQTFKCQSHICTP